MKKTSICLILLSLFIAACSSSDDSDPQGPDNFNRELLLANMADNIVIPAFTNLQSKLSDLDVARANFINNMSQSHLDALSTAWLDAYKAWQYVEMFNIGSAELLGGNSRGFVSFYNIFPLTVSDVETGAQTGNYDLNSSNYHDAQGFPALDFLIHGVATGDTAPIDKFTTNANASGYVDYITNVVAQMNALNNSILSDWQNSFRLTFISNTSSSATGSLNKFVNDFIFYYEKGFRANKFGIPAGNFSITPLPEKVEAFYKQDVSKELALDALDAIEDLFNGRAFGGVSTGESLASYLDFLDRSDLRTMITNQFQVARQKIQVLDDNFYQQVETDNTKMTEAYDAIQAAVVLLKVDMLQAMNISIDFVDADGD